MGVQIMGRRWTEGDISLLKYCYYSADMSLNDIAKTLKRSRDGIRNKAYDLRKTEDLHLLRRPLSYMERDFIRENYRKYPVNEIADMLGRSYDSIRSAAVDLGIAKYRYTTLSDIDNIRRLAKEGLYASQIARELKMSTTRIYKAEKKYKIRIRKATGQEKTAALRKIINQDWEAIIGKANKI